MEIRRADVRRPTAAPVEYFTGSVLLDAVHTPPDPARVAVSLVSFEPGARTHWHTHPLGQMVLVTAGCGWCQRENGPVEVIRPGDAVWFPPHEKHWHGATATEPMTHIAVQERLHGVSATWLEPVSQVDYAAGSRIASLPAAGAAPAAP